MVLPEVAELHVEEQAGIDEQQEDCGGEQEGGNGEIDIKLVDTGCEHRVDGCRCTCEDHEGAQQHLIREKQLDDAIGGGRQNDEAQRNEVQDAVIIFTGPMEIHEIADREQGRPGADMDE